MSTKIDHIWIKKQSSTNFKCLKSYRILSQTRATGLEQTNKNKTPENPHVYSERNKRGIKTFINDGSNAGIEKHKRQIENKKLADVNPTSTIITLNINRLNSLIESHMGCQLTSNQFD